ncbi:hypothetical protein FT663_00470 [Candidozyma haemuli var. vulneris]|uniref:HTH APSES-type domain-containing protein n=1 Tax=Candidozyma haemuli TaxID=45357 RepID=A0A2V1ARW3_9ASCO|nr:hypothetical protein CXQ85_002265 [[Candida] haemuloni]KAF3993447.1 hypothetical protein FT662_00576 [[Candida] haemuloni var. vulneris]KAF3995417.1 hypothetical protein FT663_00470 [[Candida] haemuloni var. vulneris]PVH20474.1 hypothetical protein CXQ85_002265 [[Candida] haemuloni]
MESPQHVGDNTANSISNQLSGTHLQKPKLPSPSVSASWTSKVYSSVYSGQKFIEIVLRFNKVSSDDDSIHILRRVRDSYINVSQLLSVLVNLGQFSEDQVDSFLENDIFTNPQYFQGGNDEDRVLYNDLRSHEVSQVRGIWIPYDKAVSVALNNGIYDIVKKLLLVDVHDYEKLPKKAESPGAVKRDADEEMTDALDGSPTKRRKTQPTQHSLVEAAAESNTNHPYCLPPSTFKEKDVDLVSEVKLKFSEIFKNDGEVSAELSSSDIKTMFQSVFEKCSARSQSPMSILDVPLDSQGKTALHYAATLASNLVEIFIELGISSPIRGDNNGESPLISAISVTNAMEKGNFVSMLDNWLWPDLWLFDNKRNSFLHHIIVSATKNHSASKYYLIKIITWMIQNANKEKNLHNLCTKIINAQDSESGNTALHLAGEHELRWFIFVLLELRADSQQANNVGVKPADFEAVKEVIQLRESYLAHRDSVGATKTLLENLDVSSEEDEYFLQLVHTGVEFWEKTNEYPDAGNMEHEQGNILSGQKNGTSEHERSPKTLSHSERIFKSIQDLMSDTNEEYSKIINSKKKEINNLNKELRGATIITANNRFVAKKVLEKVSLVDTMKLQMANIAEKLQVLKKKLPDGEKDEEVFTNDLANSELVKFDADEPFIIRPIYDKLANNEDVESTDDIIENLPPAEVLQARLSAYKEVNGDLEKELENLLNYSTLTAKFKKVVSYCTGVDINEVDELLDGLLEAVEGQQ